MTGEGPWRKRLPHTAAETARFYEEEPRPQRQVDRRKRQSHHFTGTSPKYFSPACRFREGSGVSELEKPNSKETPMKKYLLFTTGLPRMPAF
jgi:hypothetical protein